MAEPQLHREQPASEQLLGFVRSSLRRHEAQLRRSFRIPEMLIFESLKKKLMNNRHDYESVSAELAAPTFIHSGRRQ
jgi:hypothetical protein